MGVVGGASSLSPHWVPSGRHGGAGDAHPIGAPRLSLQGQTAGDVLACLGSPGSKDFLSE